MRIALLFMVGLTSLTMALGQPCTPENIGSLPGKWVDVYGSVDPKDKDLLAFVKKTFQENLKWSPVGGNIMVGGYSSDGGGVDRPKPISDRCAWYEASVYFKPFRCSRGKIEHADGGNDGVYVRFNDLPFGFDKTFHVPNPEATDQHPDVDPQTDTYTLLGWLPEEKDGYLEYLDDRMDGTGEHPGLVVRYRVLIKPGKLPYALMSKKEYYEKSRLMTLGTIANAKSSMARINSGSPGFADLKKMTDDLVAVYQKKIDGIDLILKTHSVEALSQPAFQGEEEGEYFESRQASDYLRRYVVKPNLNYYDSKIPRHIPQLITLSIDHVVLRSDEDKIPQGDNIYYAWDRNMHNPLLDMHFIDLFTEKLRPFIAK